DAGLSQRRRGKENQDSAEQPPARALYASCEHTDLLELPTPVVRMNCAYYIPLVIGSQAFCPNYFRNDLQSFPGARRRTVTPPERQTWSRATARNAVRRPNGSAPAPPAGVRSRGRRPGTTHTPSVDEPSATAARVARRRRTIPRQPGTDGRPARGCPVRSRARRCRRAPIRRPSAAHRRCPAPTAARAAASSA